MKKGLILFLLVILAFMVSGCMTVEKKDKEMITPGLLEPQSLMKFSDVPVPSSFKLLPQASYSFESSGLRVALLKYEGKADSDQIVNFYKEQMSMYNWRLLNVVEYGDKLLNFDRESETCIISLAPKGKNTVITISIGPKAQNNVKKVEKPLK